jgi:lysophospholipase L1-like esterase
MFPYYTKDINALRYLHKKYNQTIRDVAAKESVILCDLDSQYPVESRLFTDQAHLNADGYEIFAKIVCDSISGQLKTDSVH